MTSPSQRRGGVPLGGSTNSMQVVIKDQEAAAQAMRQAATEISTASTMLVNMLGNLDPMGNLGTGSTRRGMSGPNGGRPTVGDNQSKRPVHGSGHGLNGIRRSVANMAHNRFGAASGPTFTPQYDGDGNVVGHIQRNPDGTVVRRSGDNAATEEELAGATSRSALSGKISAFAEGGLGGAARALPYVGAAATVAEAGHEVLSQIGKQRESNAQYQSIFGGSNAGTGFSNRAQQEGFSLSQLFSGGLTPGQSRQAFQGVSALGFQGSQRSSDLNFISSNYKQLGMGVAESLQLITTASKDANTHLVGIADSLKQVTSAAQGADINAGTARQMYAQNYATLGAAFQGPQTSTLASNITATQVGLGRTLQQNFNIAPAMTNYSTLGAIAGMTGQSITQIQGSLAGNGASAAASGYADDVVSMATKNFMTPAVVAAINKAVDAFPGKITGIQALKNKDDFLQPLAVQLMQSNLVNPQAIATSINSIAPGTLTSNDPVAAVMALIANKIGLMNYGATANAKIASTQQNLKKATPNDPGSLNTSRAGTPSRAGGGPTGKPSATTYSGKAGTNAKGVNPVVDDAMKSYGSSNVIVSTPGGQRVVSMKVAAAQYTDQVAKGTAVLADTGQSLAQALGESEKNYDYAATGTKDTTSNAIAGVKGPSGKKSGLKSASGESVDAYTGSKSTSGTVTIVPSAALQKLLSFSTTGNVAISTTSAANGTTPAPGTGLGN